MTITIEMPDAEVAQLKQITKLSDNAQAVVQAAKEYLRVSQLRQLKDVSGKVDYEANWEAQETLELAELAVPPS